MNEKLCSIQQEILDGIEAKATSRATAFELRKQFLDSKTGTIGQLMKEMKNIAPEERANYGKEVNELKAWATDVFAKLDDDEEYGDMFVDAITGQDLLCSSTLVVIVDVNNKNLFEAPDVFQNANNVAIIDHHRKTEDFSREIAISYIEPSASSASELVCEILEQVLPSNTLPKVESELLLSGIILDTKNFTGSILFDKYRGSNIPRRISSRLKSCT